jgi:hypothetical protein
LVVVNKHIANWGTWHITLLSFPPN